MALKYDGILFDIDGTLTATNELIFASFNHILGKYLGKQYTNQEIIALFGPTEEVIIQKYFPDNYLEVIEDYYGFYSANHTSMAAAYPGIPELVQEVKARGPVVGAFTGKGRRAAEITLREEGLNHFVDMLISGDDVINHKPHHEGIDKFLAAYGLPKEKVIMIGDSHVDIIAARGAGVKVVSVLWDSYSEDKVRLHKPDFIAHSVSELRGLLFSD